MHGSSTDFAAGAARGPGAATSIGTVEVDPSTRRLLGPQDAVKLEPRVLQVLIELIAASGQVVTRAHLFERCWNGVPVGDDSLNRVVFELRQALRAVGGASTIETIPRTGYRLVGWDSDVAPPRASETLAVAPTPRPTIDRRWLLGGALASAGAAAAAQGG